MSDLQEELKAHCTGVVLETAGRLQTWSGAKGIQASNGEAKCDGSTSIVDGFGEELLNCVQSVPMPQVLWLLHGLWNY